MTARRLAALIAVGLVLEVAVFHIAYADLIALRGTSERVSGDASCRTLNRTLQRASITRDHLEGAIVVALQCGDQAAETAALRRLDAEFGTDDPQVALRLGEALRRAGQLDEAARAFDRALRAAARTEPVK